MSSSSSSLSSSSSSSSPITIPLHRLTERRQDATLSPRSPHLSDPSEQNSRMVRAFQSVASSPSSLSDLLRSPRKPSDKRLSKSAGAPSSPREKCIHELEEMLTAYLSKESDARQTSDVRLNRTIRNYCYAIENRTKTAKEITDTFQNTNILIEDIIDCFNLLEQTLKKKEEKTLQQTLALEKIKMLTFSCSKDGLSGFFVVWNGDIPPYIKKIFENCVNLDKSKMVDAIALLKSWADPRSIKKIENILNDIHNQQQQINDLRTHKYAWVNERNDQTLLNIDWSQVIRSLVQSKALINTLTIGDKILNTKQLEGSSTTSKQKFFMRALFIALADELDAAEQRSSTSPTLTNIPPELPEKNRLDSFCLCDELSDIRERIINLGVLAFTIPMMLSSSCWSMADWMIRRTLFPDLYPKNYSKSGGAVGYNTIDEEGVYPDLMIKVNSDSNYSVLQRRTFKIVYNKPISQEKAMIPIPSPRNLPAIAHVTFQFFIYPSQEHAWEGNISVHQLTVYDYDHLAPLIQIFGSASINRGDAGVVIEANESL